MVSGRRKTHRAFDEKRGSTRRNASAEDAIRDSQARLESVLSTEVDAIIVIDEQGVIESVNPAFRRIFGYPPEEVVGENVSLLMTDPYRSEHDGYICRYLRSNDPRIIGIGREVEGRRKDGTTFPIELAVSEMWLGSRRMFTGIVRDISRAKAAEAALKDSRTWYRAVLEQDVHLAGILSPQGLVLDCSQRALEISGLEPSDVIGRQFWETWWWSHSAGLRRRLREGVREAAAGDDVRFEATHPRPDGTLVPVEFSLRPVRDEADRVALLVAESHDVTIYKEVERKVRQAEERAGQYLDIAMVMIVALDASGAVTLVNKRGCELLGYDRAEIVGKEWFEAFLPERERNAARARLFTKTRTF